MNTHKHIHLYTRIFFIVRYLQDVCFLPILHIFRALLYLVLIFSLPTFIVVCMTVILFVYRNFPAVLFSLRTVLATSTVTQTTLEGGRLKKLYETCITEENILKVMNNYKHQETEM